MTNQLLSTRTILLVDDHPINIDSYRTLLSALPSNDKAQYLLAFDCKQAYETIAKCNFENKKIDFAFIDISLPEFEEQQLFSGSDVSLLVRKIFPLCKIIIISMHKEPNWVNQIFKSINPEGFIAKSDISYKCFPEIFKSIENNETYLSESIAAAAKTMVRQNLIWDDVDSKMLQLLSEGIKTRDLPNFIPISLSSIEKRKSNLKRQLVLNAGSDKDLIDEVKNLGLI